MPNESSGAKDLAAPGARKVGRQPVSSRTEIEHAAFTLFDERGFDLTTIDDIAAAAGIARRTFFSYFASKNDVPWGSFESQLDHLRVVLAATSDDIPLMDALRLAVLDFNTVAEAEQLWHRRRLALILNTPALQAHSTLRYTAWRGVVTDFVARRLSLPDHDIVVQAIGYTALGASVAAYEVWLGQEDGDLLALIDTSYRQLADGFRHPGEPATGARSGQQG
jgi:mycofactocin system transcriptional regulator